MKEILEDATRWLSAGEAVALATVVHTWGSAPRKVGAKMAMTAAGSISGSVSGGCVEGAVFEAGVEALKSQQPQLLHFGVADETAWDVGLACGGTIEIFVESLDTAVFSFMRDLVEADAAGAAVTVIRGDEALLGNKLLLARSGKCVGTLGNVDLDRRAAVAANSLVHPQRLRLGGDVEIFIDTVRPAPQLVMVGGVHIAVALTSMAKMLGYRTVVIDPRRAFGSPERFAHVDILIQAWPQKAFKQVALTPETAVALLTHDPKIDDPALKIVLAQPVFYVGALGSRKTHAKRVARLRDAGLSDARIGRIYAPIGLDIAARTPEEIALAVMAEIVKARHAAPQHV